MTSSLLHYQIKVGDGHRYVDRDRLADVEIGPHFFVVVLGQVIVKPVDAQMEPNLVLLAQTRPRTFRVVHLVHLKPRATHQHCNAPIN